MSLQASSPMNTIAPHLTAVSQVYGCTDLAIELSWPRCPSGRFHAGIDYYDPADPTAVGQPLYAARDGVIYKLGRSSVIESHDLGPYAVCLYVPDERVWLWYGHCSYTYVTEGQNVRAGDLIAAVGNEGASQGPHLHLEARYYWPDPSSVEEIVYGSEDPSPYFQIASSPISNPTGDIMPSEVMGPSFPVSVVGSYDVMDNINVDLVNAYASVRSTGGPVSGVMVFVRRSDGTPVASKAISLDHGAGDELSTVGLTGIVGSFVWQHQSGSAQVSGKVGVK